MSVTIKLKRGTSEPSSGNLVAGEVAINTDDGNLYTKLDDGSVSNVVAKTRKLTAVVRNETGSTIPAFSAVYINGASGNKATVTLAKADSEATSSKTFGITVANIANNNNGEVIVSGILEKVDTSSLSAGDTLWLSPSTAGAFTTTKPTAPNHAVFIGIVTRSHATQGTVEVRIQNGYELSEIHNVSASSPSNGDVLTYNSSTGLWENAAPTGGGGGGTWGSITGTVTDQTDLTTYISGLGYSTMSDAPSDGKAYSRKDGTWVTDRINNYDNYVTYQAGDQVVYGNAIYYLNSYIGAAGYDPSAYPYYWTAISGPAGSAGTNGASIVYQGTWNYSTPYVVNDWVVYSGLPYICIYSNMGNTPDVSPSYWTPLYINGTNGTNGSNGTNGTNGLNGTMNALDILTITGNGYGAYVSVGVWSVNYSFINNGYPYSGWAINKYPTVYFNLYLNGTLDSTISGSYSYYYASGTPVFSSLATGDHIEVKLSDGAGGEATINYADFYI